MLWFRRATKGGDESAKALADATKSLHEIESRGDEVNKTSDSLRDLRNRNHFIEALERIIVPPGGPLDTRH